MTAYKIGAFGEYAYVERHSADLDRLKRLHQIRLTQTEARALVVDLCVHFGLPYPEFKFTGKTDRGEYDAYTRTIRVRPTHISAWVLLHELAHHWVRLRCPGVPWHSHDFTRRLDRLAEAAETLRGESDEES